MQSVGGGKTEVRSTQDPARRESSEHDHWQRTLGYRLRRRDGVVAVALYCGLLFFPALRYPCLRQGKSTLPVQPAAAPPRRAYETSYVALNHPGDPGHRLGSATGHHRFLVAKCLILGRGHTVLPELVAKVQHAPERP